MRLIFPQIPRIISAGVLWTTMASLVGYNFVLAQTKPLAYSDKVFGIFARPESSVPHEALAGVLWNGGARTLARQELALVAELSPVLGAQTSDEDEREAKNMTYWKDAVATYPDYRDAYIQLAALSYAQGNLLETHAYLTRAAALDPNGKTVRDLLGFVSTQLSK